MGSRSRVVKKSISLRNSTLLLFECCWMTRLRSAVLWIIQPLPYPRPVQPKAGQRETAEQHQSLHLARKQPQSGRLCWGLQPAHHVNCKARKPEQRRPVVGDPVVRPQPRRFLLRGTFFDGHEREIEEARIAARTVAGSSSVPAAGAQATPAIKRPVISTQACAGQASILANAIQQTPISSQGLFS